MKKLFRIVLVLILMSITSFAEDKVLYQSEFENGTVYIDVNSYKILQFNKRIKNLQLTNSDKIVAEILENNEKPLTTIKIYAKEAGNESSIVTFQDDTIISIGFNIVPHLKNLITMLESQYPELKVEQINDTIFLKGKVANQKDKTKILDVITKFGIETDKKVVDLLSTSNPKMIRIKLYAVEVNNDKGLTIKNNWLVSTKKSYENTTDQTVTDLETTMDQIMTNAVSLTGGLTGAANYLGENFNAALTINYLAEEGVANVLDETTLITLEDKEAIFLAGGEVYVRLQAQDAVELRQINYGLELKLTAKEVMNDEFVHLNVTTRQRALDWANQVDDIPAITNKSINTTVIIKDKATVVLGGLVNSQNSKDISKIPLLGDLPILGALFKSSSFVEGKSELVFFITPEIVRAVDNNQINEFKDNKKKMFKRNEDNTQRYLDMLNVNGVQKVFSSEEALDKVETKTVEPTSTEIKTVEPTNKMSTTEPELTDEEKHQQRVNKILGY